MAEMNRHGLSRHIPAAVEREVRRRSKFGCVICRSGFYTYEHIEPTFQDALLHDPKEMCCLCGSCQDAVSRGQMSKEKVASAYERIQKAEAGTVPPPEGPLDFHEGTAELLIGGLRYSPAVRSVIRYMGTDVMRLHPSRERGMPGAISAVFTDDAGTPVLRLERNVWVGSLTAWDIEVVGPRIAVRTGPGRVVLSLRLDPPGRIVLERLDMRIGDAHVLATEETYAIGRYVAADQQWWVHASLRITSSVPEGAAIEFCAPEVLKLRDAYFGGKGQELRSKDGRIVLSGLSGILVKPLGIAVASKCGAFELSELSVGGPRSLEDMRRMVFHDPGHLAEFISRGSHREAATRCSSPDVA